MSDEIPIAYELLGQLRALELKVVESKHEDFGENHRTRIVLKEDPEILERCSMGLLFAFGVLSYHDARPRALSEMHFKDDDQWTVEDLLRHLHFRRGELGFYADYVRGRMMKTEVDISADGTVVVEALNRGQSALRWVSLLQGKKPLSVIKGDGE